MQAPERSLEPRERPPARQGRVHLPPSAPADVEHLAAELARTIEGEVRFDAGCRALYATDGSNYRQIPIGVVIPRHKDDVVATVAACRKAQVPILSRGGGTSLAGQCCNVAVVMDFSKLVTGVLELDAANKRARVLPGTILDTLRDAAVVHDLTFAPDPATHDHCTLGGMMGNNSCGVHSVMAGRTADNVEELEILTYRGERMRVGRTSPEELESIVRAGGERGRIYRALRDLRDRVGDLVRARFPKIPRRVSGYNLDELLPENGFQVARALIGTEGTCVTILEATLRLVDWPKARSLVVLGYPDVYRAADHVCEILEFQPLALEGLDDLLVEFIKKKGLHPERLKELPEGGGFLLVELGGRTQEEADHAARRLMDALRARPDAPTMTHYDDPAEQEKVWKIRESGLGATARVPGMPDTWPGWEDSAVPVPRLGEYLRELRALFDRYDYHPSLYGHFGQACVHCRVDFDVATAEGIKHYRSFVGEAADLVVRFGGSLSGEHGDGQSRAELLPKMFGPELVRAFGDFKAIWDPDGRMNPGKVVDPHRITDDLRLGADFHSPKVETHFKYPDDDGDFTRATLRCVGVGTCRRADGGVMCPSFMVTREEEHTTRGRAHLLFEMMRGAELEGWRDDHVRESLDLCLACKGCKGECPVNVDMATYKAEFLSHYYEGRLRPMAAYTMGLIHWWSRLAALAPRLANFVTHAPVISPLLKRLAGIAPEREMPKYATQTFKSWFRARSPKNQGREQVLLWPDTFNNHFFPQTAIAAVEVLEAAGYEVLVPEPSLCCGRPLYDFGMLDTAKRLLRQTLAALADPIERGVPLVGLEPSCVSVFRDEMRSLFPDDPAALKLRDQTYFLTEFLAEKAPHWKAPRLDREAIVQGHCHHQSVLRFDDERRVLEAMGLHHHVLDSGCCGMAGAFGFEAGDKYEVSMKAGERKLLPAVREAPKEALIVANGFSCREQIELTTDRRALHVAELLHLGLRKQALARYPEESYLPPKDAYDATPGTALAAVAAGVGVVLGARALRRARGPRRLRGLAVDALVEALRPVGLAAGRFVIEASRGERRLTRSRAAATG